MWQKLITIPFSDCQICSKLVLFVIHHLTIFDALIQIIESDFGVFPEITIGNLCKPFHDVIIIPFSSFSWKHKDFGKKEENFKTLNT